MSAITGIFYRNGRSVEDKFIKKMNQCLSHRGLDGSDIWCEGSVGLGHQMLHTTPESLYEKLPNEEDGLVITSDARIDNRKELSLKLAIENKKDVPDSFFILKAYQKWGEKCLEELIGDFAFAIWDKKKETLFCARDHMGIKPFYYYISDEVFFFATEIKGILSNFEVPIKINEVRVAQHLVTMNDDQEITFYEGINRLPAACLLVLGENDYFLEKYWFLDPTFELKLNSDQEYIDKFREIFTESINCRMRSAFQLGSLLSGGLDSSSIVCIARHLLRENGGEPLKTFSAVFEDDILGSEKNFINAVVEGGDINPYYVRVDNVGPLFDHEKILWYEDEALWPPNVYMSWILANKAKKEDIRILLEGFGGDSVISFGKGYLKELLKKGKFISFIKELNAFSKLRNLSPYKYLIVTLLDLISPSTLDIIRRYTNQNSVDYRQRKRILNNKFAHKMNIDDIINSMLKKQQFKSPREYHYNDLDSGSLRSWWEIADKIMGAKSIESRYPFMDKRLVEFCLALPTEQKIKNGWSRVILRLAMNDLIPPKIQWQPIKSNMGQNFRRNLILFDKELLEDIIYRESELIKDYVNLDTLKKYYEIYKKTGTKNNRAIINVWRAITLALWLKSKKIGN